MLRLNYLRVNWVSLLKDPMAKIINMIWSSPHSLLVMASLMWAGHANVLKVSVGEISPMLLMGFRWIGCFILLTLFLWVDVKKQIPSVNKRLPWVMIMGGIGMAGFTICLIVAAHSTSAINLGITQSFIPALVMLLGLIILKNSISKAQGLGLVLSMLGAVILVSKGSIQTLLSLTFNPGDLIMLIGCFCYAGYTLGLSKRIDMPPTVMFVFFSFFASLTLCIFIFIEFLNGDLVLPGLKGIIILIYCIIFPSILAQTFFMRGVELLGANRAGLYVNLVPVFTALIAIIFLSEYLFIFHVISLLLVLSGIFITERYKETPEKI